MYENDLGKPVDHPGARTSPAWFQDASGASKALPESNLRFTKDIPKGSYEEHPNPDLLCCSHQTPEEISGGIRA